MAAPKRNDTQIARDRADIARLYLRGETQVAIAAILSDRRAGEGLDYEISRSMVARDLGEMRKEWRESALLDFDARKAQELAKLDHIEATAWEAWERSHGETVTRTEKSSEDGYETAVKTEYLAGDPRFLQIALSAVERRCRILGIDAPKKIAPTTPDGTEPYEIDPVVAISARLDEIARRQKRKRA